MTQARAVRRRLRLRGWVRYTPFLAIPFSLFAFEVWAHHTQIQNDYETGGIRRDLRQISARMDELHDDVARLERLDRMQSQAPDLGLVAPTPTQVRIVRLPVDGAPVPADRAIELAQLDIIADELLMGTAEVD